MSQFDFYGPNAGYVLDLYDRYQQSPDAVDAATRRFFEQWTPPTNGNGHVIADAAPQAAAGAVDFRKVVGAVNLAQAIRLYGHLDAKLDPLNATSIGDPELSPSAHGITIEVQVGLEE